ncbi:DUF2970 domain-containing protein [Microbulbifer sediminum]|uniref:DUF2970 domain-containing protein n=1 Tax=Microbulbifer sediminum TaxID=2904250 RepID=UPI001F44A4F7|nr:DUF2970 domain-containing protein [Microbulbifer sediminum]
MPRKPEDTQQTGHTAQDDMRGNSPSFGQVVLSTLAAAIGVQSSKNRERDFSSGNIKAYIAAGIIFTALFVSALVLIVKLVLGNMG